MTPLLTSSKVTEDGLISVESRESRQVLIFANPIAGRGRGRKTAERLRGALGKAGFEAVCVFDRPGTAVLPEGPHHAVVSIGGDGTLRAVVSRLARDEEGKFSRVPPPMLVIPTGTANLVKQNLLLKWSHGKLEHEVVEAIRAYKVVGRDASTSNGELFLIIAGAGLDGQIIHELEARRKGPISLLSYTMPTVASLLMWKYPVISVEVDGVRVFGPARGMAMAGNIREHGIGFCFLHRAVPDDGLMDVLAFECNGLTRGLDLLLHAANGSMTEEDGVVYVRGKRCRIVSHEAPVAVQADGEAAGFTPVEMEMLPFQVPFLVQHP